MPTDTPTVLVAAKVSPATRTRFAALARDRGVTVSQLIRALIDRELENEL